MPTQDERVAVARPHKAGAVTGDALNGRTDVSLIQVGIVLLRHIRIVLGVPVVFGVLAVAITLLRGTEYQAMSSFLPQVSRSPLSRYSGLASQFGVSLPVASEGTGESVAFYAELLTTRSLLENTARSTYRVPGEAGQTEVEGDLVALLGVDGETPELQTLEVVDRLRESVDVNTSPTSGVIQIVTRAPWPSVAVDVNRRLLDLLNEYNLERRQSQAAAERFFAESRMHEVERAVLAAEDEMQEFLEENRSYQSSPQLTFEAGRLQRRLDQQQQLFGTLSQAYEQARLEEVRNTPVLTIIDSPEGAAEPVPRLLVLKALLAMTIGLMIGVATALIRTQSDRTRALNPDEYARFVSLWQSAFSRKARREPVPAGGVQSE